MIFIRRIDGSIGIGTDSPDNTNCRVEGHINLDDNNAIAWGGTQRPAVIGHKTDKVLQFYTDSDVTTKDKNVGIGTESPNRKLVVKDVSETEFIFCII